MKRQALTVSVLWLLSIFFGASACTRSPSPDIPAPTSTVDVERGRGPFVEGTATLEGAIDGTGDIEILYPLADEARSSCAAIARGDQQTRSYAIPLPSEIGKDGLLWRASIRNYGGPGDFDEGDLAALSVEVRSDDSAVTYEKDDATTASITVREDNSGSIAFTDLREPEGGRISGSARWTCR